MEMPGGVFWLDKKSHNGDVVYGEVGRSLHMLRPYALSGLVFGGH